MKKTKRKNGQKGITLIALIITIIVLIILAGISIMMISRQDFAIWLQNLEFLFLVKNTEPRQLRKNLI